MFSALRATARGPWGAVFRCLASPWLAWLIIIWLGVQALVGLGSAPGQHPAYGVLVRLPAALLPFCLLARWGTVDMGRSALPYLGCVLGLFLALFGAVSAGSAGGYAALGAARPTESFVKEQDGQKVPVHLGGQVRVAPGDAGVNLALSAGGQEIARGTVAYDRRTESQVGPWSLYLRDVRTGLEPVYAVLSLSPRAGGDPVERRVRVGQGTTLPDDTELTVLKVSGDFISSLGPAAQLRLDWSGRGETSWHFVESADLDERTGRAPWSVRLSRLEPEPRMTFGVRRAGPFWIAATGWLVVGLSLCGFVGSRRRE